MQIDETKLRGRYICLTLLKPEDMGFLKSLAQDARLWEYTKSILVDDAFEAHWDKYISVALDENANGGQHSFVIRRTIDDDIIGMTRFYKVDDFHKRASIGFTWYKPDVWGGPENKECKLLLLQYLFEHAHFQRAEFEVAHQNIRSQKAVVKIGATLEGRLRKHGKHADGTLRDTLVYSIIDDEWPQRKKALQHLLAAYT
jgi:N-acetyltransferase